ncbi:hypothetical protein BN2877_35630 [Achromobacter xylosoxidans]|nr:hypothetical protein BN2877_35630 [Achromobacter xylosoxidans]
MPSSIISSRSSLRLSSRPSDPSCFSRPKAVGLGRLTGARSGRRILEHKDRATAADGRSRLSASASHNIAHKAWSDAWLLWPANRNWQKIKKQLGAWIADARSDAPPGYISRLTVVANVMDAITDSMERSELNPKQRTRLGKRIDLLNQEVDVLLERSQELFQHMLKKNPTGAIVRAEAQLTPVSDKIVSLLCDAAKYLPELCENPVFGPSEKPGHLLFTLLLMRKTIPRIAMQEKCTPEEAIKFINAGELSKYWRYCGRIGSSEEFNSLAYCCRSLGGALLAPRDFLSSQPPHIYNAGIDLSDLTADFLGAHTRLLKTVTAALEMPLFVGAQRVEQPGVL